MQRSPEHETIPDGWQRVRLGDVAEIITGGTPSRQNGDFFGGQVPWIKPSDLAMSRFASTSEEYLTEAGASISRRVPENSVLVSCIGTIGEVGITARPLCFNQQINALLPKDTITSSYLYWACWGRAQLLQAISSKTAVPIVNKSTLSKVTILLPPLPEQRAIAAVLDSIDDAIEGAEAVIAATEGLRDAMLHDLLTRGLPGQHTEFRDVPGLGTIPAYWEVVRLGDVAEVTSGQVDPRDKRFQNQMFVAPDDIESRTGRLINRRTVADAGAISGKYQFDIGDVLYSKIRPYLMKAYVPAESGLCSADVYPIRASESLEANFLAKIVLSSGFTEYIRTCSDRTGIPKVNRVDLFKYRLALPNLKEQQAIAAALDGVDATLEVAQEELAGLRLLRESTANALLSGRVRVMTPTTLEGSE